MKALVTGGAGFIGSHLVELLVAAGHDVIVVDNLNSGRLSNLEGLDISFYPIDIRDMTALRPLFDGVDWVFHLAGLADIVPSIEQPLEYHQVNVDGTFNVLECARAVHAKKVVYAASSSCYGLPTEVPTSESAAISVQYPYALTKYLGEEIVLHWGKVYRLPVISLRLFNVYGPRSRTTGSYGAVFGVFLAQKLHNKPFTVVGDGQQTRDFTYVTDVAEAFYQAALSNVSGEVFNVGSSSHQSINRLVELLDGEATHIPKRPGEPDHTFADITKIKKLLNWTPKVSFEEGVQRLLASIHDYKDAPVWDPEAIAKATGTWFKYLGDKTTCLTSGSMS